MKKLVRVSILYVSDIFLIAFIGFLINLLLRKLGWDHIQFRPLVFGIATMITTLLIVFFLIKKKMIVLDFSVNKTYRHILLIIVLGILALGIRHLLFGFKFDQGIQFDRYFILNRLFPVLIVAPICEELFFRNVIQKMLSDCLSIHFAVILASVIFAFEHMFSSSFSGLFFLYHLIGGIIYGYSYFYSGSILVSIGIHFLFNLSTFLVPFFLA